MSPMRIRSEKLRTRESGAALVVSLVLLLVLTVLGVASMRTTTLQERMAGNLRDGNLAFQSAEAALREGEEFLEQATIPPFTGSGGLLQRQTDAGLASFWTTFGWEANSQLATERQDTAGRPRYVIEELPAVPGEGDSVAFGALPEVGFYRITARGIGGTTDAIVILQSTYRR